MSDMSGRGRRPHDPEAPPPKIHRKRNAVVRLFDAPLWADWIFWLLLFWTVFSFFAILSEPSSSQLPSWIDGLLAAAFFGATFGILPAWLRLAVRRRRHERAKRVHTYRRPHESTSDTTSEREEQPRATERSVTTKTLDRPAVDDASQSTTSPRTLMPISQPGLAIAPLLRVAREQMPYPVAGSIRRLQLAVDARDQYDAALAVGESLIVTLGVSASVWLREHQVSLDAQQTLRMAFDRGVSLGTWAVPIAAYGRMATQDEHAFPGSDEAFRKGRGGSGLLAGISTLIEERNRSAHGGRPRHADEANTRLQALLPALQTVLERADFLTRSPWFITDSVSYRKRTQDFQVAALRAMGDHPEFERFHLNSSKPLENDTFYALTPNGPLDLTPYIVMRFCETCGQREMCYADKLHDKHGVGLKTFDRGHDLWDPTLRSEFDPMGSANDQQSEST